MEDKYTINYFEVLRTMKSRKPEKTNELKLQDSSGSDDALDSY
jgi:hypothetical protein